MYAIYHGNKGIYEKATYVENLTTELKNMLLKLGLNITNTNHFDTLTIKNKNARNFYNKLKKFNYIAFMTKKNQIFCQYL